MSPGSVKTVIDVDRRQRNSTLNIAHLRLGTPVAPLVASLTLYNCAPRSVFRLGQLSVFGENELLEQGSLRNVGCEPRPLYGSVTKYPDTLNTAFRPLFGLGKFVDAKQVMFVPPSAENVRFLASKYSLKSPLTET